MSERREANVSSFVFTSGIRSPHHRHMGYGVKSGLEGLEFKYIQRFEVPCLQLAHTHQARQGELVLIIDGDEKWRGTISISKGTEPSGRPNMLIQGVAPPHTILQDTYDAVHQWKFEERSQETIQVIDLMTVHHAHTNPTNPRSLFTARTLGMMIFLLIAYLVYTLMTQDHRPEWHDL